jgi:hypothetical protein
LNEINRTGELISKYGPGTKLLSIAVGAGGNYSYGTNLHQT